VQNKGVRGLDHKLIRKEYAFSLLNKQKKHIVYRATEQISEGNKLYTTKHKWGYCTKASEKKKGGEAP